MELTSDIADFTRRDLCLLGKTKPVLLTGTTGPAIIVIHEICGFTSSLARFCRWMRDAGFRVYAPILFGAPDAGNPEELPSAMRIVSLCISREFTILRANQSSPVTDWLRALARLAHEECGGPGVGAIGMCLTGGFALSMALDPVVLASVLAQPGLPAFSPAALDIAPADLARVQERTRHGLALRGYRFEGDTLCQASRFATLRAAFGTAFTGTELPDSAGNPAGMKADGKPPHSVFTRDLIDAAGPADTDRCGRSDWFFQRGFAATGSGGVSLCRARIRGPRLAQQPRAGKAERDDDDRAGQQGRDLAHVLDAEPVGDRADGLAHEKEK
jgi:dienelactone hydrolase